MQSMMCPSPLTRMTFDWRPSIDALAVGITFAFLPGTRIVPAVALIGSITFVFSASGIRLGNVFGLRYKSKAEFAGGVILILLGTKILLEHLGVL